MSATASASVAPAALNSNALTPLGALLSEPLSPCSSGGAAGPLHSVRSLLLAACPSLPDPLVAIVLDYACEALMAATPWDGFDSGKVGLIDPCNDADDDDESESDESDESEDDESTLDDVPHPALPLYRAVAPVPAAGSFHVQSLLCLPDGGLAVGCAGGVVSIYAPIEQHVRHSDERAEEEEGEEVDTRPLRQLEGHTGAIHSLCLLSPSLLASGSADCSLRVWNWQTGECVRVLRGHCYPVRRLAALNDAMWPAPSPAHPDVAESEPRAHLWSCAEFDGVRWWSVEEGCSIFFQRACGSRIHRLATLNDGCMLALSEGSRDGSTGSASSGVQQSFLECWRLERVDEGNKLEGVPMEPHGGEIISPGPVDPRTNYPSEQYGLELQLGSVRVSKVQLPPPLSSSAASAASLSPSHRRTSHALLLPAGSSCLEVLRGNIVAVSGSGDGVVRLLSVRAGAAGVLACFRAHDKALRVLRALPACESLLLTAGLDRHIRVWDWSLALRLEAEKKEKAGPQPYASVQPVTLRPVRERRTPEHLLEAVMLPPVLGRLQLARE